MRVVHYLNQFFAGLGGEAYANLEPRMLDGPQGPGRALAALGLDIDLTLVCGDDYFSQHEDSALTVLLGWIEERRPDALICGPSLTLASSSSLKRALASCTDQRGGSFLVDQCFIVRPPD